MWSLVEMLVALASENAVSGRPAKSNADNSVELPLLTPAPQYDPPKVRPSCHSQFFIFGSYAAEDSLSGEGIHFFQPLENVGCAPFSGATIAPILQKIQHKKPGQSQLADRIWSLVTYTK